jgi:hypothetical protein
VRDQEYDALALVDGFSEDFRIQNTNLLIGREPVRPHPTKLEAQRYQVDEAGLRDTPLFGGIEFVAVGQIEIIESGPPSVAGAKEEDYS